MGFSERQLSGWNCTIYLIKDCFRAHGANIDFGSGCQSDLHVILRERGGAYFYQSAPLQTSASARSS